MAVGHGYGVGTHLQVHRFHGCLSSRIAPFVVVWGSAAGHDCRAGAVVAVETRHIFGGNGNDNRIRRAYGHRNQRRAAGCIRHGGGVGAGAQVAEHTGSVGLRSQRKGVRRVESVGRKHSPAVGAARTGDIGDRYVHHRRVAVGTGSRTDERRTRHAAAVHGLHFDGDGGAWAEAGHGVGIHAARRHPAHTAHVYEVTCGAGHVVPVERDAGVGESAANDCRVVQRLHHDYRYGVRHVAAVRIHGMEEIGSGSSRICVRPRAVGAGKAGSRRPGIVNAVEWLEGDGPVVQGADKPVLVVAQGESPGAVDGVSAAAPEVGPGAFGQPVSGKRRVECRSRSDAARGGGCETYVCEIFSGAAAVGHQFQHLSAGRNQVHIQIVHPAVGGVEANGTDHAGLQHGRQYAKHVDGRRHRGVYRVDGQVRAD